MGKNKKLQDGQNGRKAEAIVVTVGAPTGVGAGAPVEVTALAHGAPTPISVAAPSNGASAPIKGAASPNGAQERSNLTQLEIPKPPEGRSNHREEPLFVQHPLTDAYTSQHGVLMPTDFHGYDLDGTGIVCLADLDEVRKYLAGAGYAPVRVNERYAIVSLLLNKYYDSSVGAYNAIVINIFAARQEIALPWTDATCALTPMFNPYVDVVIGPYAMSRNTRAADIGRDLMGMNKLETAATIEHHKGGTTAATIFDNGGRKLLHAQVTRPTLRDSQFQGPMLLDNLHMPAFPPKAPLPKAFVGYDPSSTLQPATTQAIILSQPSFKPWGPDDRLEAEKGIHVTDLLIRFKVRPILITRDDAMSVVLKPQKRQIALGVQADALASGQVAF
jgi:hypothetical protein